MQKSCRHPAPPPFYPHYRNHIVISQYFVLEHNPALVELSAANFLSVACARMAPSGGEAVIRDTWMSAKCPSRRFYDVLVASAFPLIPMLVKTISSSEGLLKRLVRENHGKATAD